MHSRPGRLLQAPGQTLAGIAALSSTLARKLAAGSLADPAAAFGAAGEITGLVNEAIAEARELARGLNPAGLEQGGLGAALEALAENVRSLFGVSCTFESGTSLPKLRPEVEAHLFRIAQEAVGNAVAHAQGQRIEIGLAREYANRLEVEYGLLSIRDDGVGLPEEAPDRDGLGMHTMAYRSRACLEVRRRARRGTAVICAFPLPAPPES